MLNLARAVQRAAKQKTVALAHEAQCTSVSKQALTNMIMRANSTSQVAVDFNKVVGPKNHGTDPFVGTNVMPGAGSSSGQKLERGHFSSQLEDYGVTNSDATFNFESMALNKDIDVDALDVHKYHPLEHAMRQARETADVYANLQDNQVLFTNLPVDLAKDAEILSTRDKLRQFLIDKVHKDLQIKKISHIDAITAFDASPRTAFIKITLGSKRQAFMVQKALRKTWMSDCLLKVKTSADVNREVHGNRTILIRNIPRDYNERLILQVFVPEEAGAVTGIELPMEHKELAEQSYEQAGQFGRQIKAQKTKEFEEAQKVVDSALKDGMNYPGLNAGGQDVAVAQTILDQKQEKKLDGEKLQSLLKTVTLLQSEGAQVVQSKQHLLGLLSETIKTGSISQSESAVDVEKLLAENKDALEGVARYLKANSEAVENDVSKPIEDMMKLSQGELAIAFDHILAALSARESLISKRLEEAVRFIGIEERILVQQKDFDKELEDISAAFQTPADFKPEQIISVQQQIADVIANKNYSAEDKFLELLDKTLNPFRTFNFGDKELRNVRGEDIDHMKLLEVVDPRLTKEEANEEREGTDFQQDVRKQIDSMVSELRGKFDMPFDELYHKERNIVQNVIKAEQALKDKQAKLPSPMQHGTVDRQAADTILGESILKDDLLPSANSHSHRLATEHIQDANASGQFASGYDFKSQSDNILQQKVEAGIMTQSDVEQLKQFAREQQMQNKGYVFVTFSHSDEARMFLVRNSKKLLGAQEINVDLKANVDHSEMDFQYFMQRSKNDSQIIDEIVNLRKVKQELRDFEAHGLEQDMPNSIKLKEFREHAKQLIENNKGFVRTDKTERTVFEEETLMRKMRDLQARYPHVDMTQLFGTERAEDARQALHKRAFASYKQYEFLKAGLNEKGEKPDSKLSDAKRRLKENDPYNFPALDQTVAKVLSKDVMTAQLLDNGEIIDTPGRRFKGYTEQEYLEAFFGKDMMRVGVVDKKEDPLFMPQKSLKERHPLNNYLKLPKAQARLDKIKELGLEPDYLNLEAGKHPYPRDKELAAVMKRMEGPILDGQLMHDPEHEENPSLDLLTGDYLYEEDEGKPIRTRLSDIDNMLEKYAENRRNRGMPNTVNVREMRQLLQRIDDEYEPVVRKNDPEDFMTYIKQGSFMPRKDLPEEGEEGEVGGEGQDQKFEQSYASGLSRGRKLQNKQQLDDLRRAERNWDGDEGEFEVEVRSKLDEHLDKLNEKRELEGKSELTLEEYYQKTKGHKPIAGADKQFRGGDLTYKHSLGDDLEHSSFGKHQQVKERHLNEFINSSSSTQKDEDQDEMDVFERYQQFLKKEKDQSPRDDIQDQSQKVKLDKDLHQPEMPRFQDYFAQQAKNVHPFDKIANEVNDSVRDDYLGEQSEQDLARERNLYHRELIGRLMGGKLSPRQFEQLFGNFQDADAKLTFVKDALSNEKFLSDRDMVRLAEEQFEKFRRQGVKQGKWTEEQSVQKLNEHLAEVQRKTPSANKKRQLWRDYVEAMVAVDALETPEALFEREYYFDEGLGQSLQEHVTELKEKFPGAQVWSRRDKDGFAKVKLTFEQEFKYNLKNIEDWDKDVAQDLAQGAQEQLLKKLHPEGISGDVTEQDLTEELQRFLTEGKLHQSNEIDIDSWTRLKLQELAQGIMSGKVAQEDIVAKFDEITAESQTATAAGEPVFKLDTTRSIFNQAQTALEADRHQFGTDVFVQLKQRIKKHLNYTERKHEDFIKPKLNEKHQSERRIQAQELKIQAAEQQMAWHQRSLDKKAEREQARKQAEQNGEEYLETTDYESDWEFDQRLRNSGIYDQLLDATHSNHHSIDGFDEHGNPILNPPNDEDEFLARESENPSAETQKALDYIYSGKGVRPNSDGPISAEERINRMAPTKEYIDYRKRVRGESTGRELDQESYEALKRDLAAAKERKQKLLSQGLPDYVPYLRL